MILITTGMGFIGLHTARRFVDVGEDVVIGYHRSQRAPSFLKDTWEKHVFAGPLDCAIPDYIAWLRHHPELPRRWALSRTGGNAHASGRAPRQGGES